LRLRPGLVVPVPADLSALTGRAQARISRPRAVDPLDRFTLEILDALHLGRGHDRTALGAVRALPGTGHAPPTATARRARGRRRAVRGSGRAGVSPEARPAPISVPRPRPATASWPRRETLRQRGCGGGPRGGTGAGRPGPVRARRWTAPRRAGRPAAGPRGA